MANSSRPSRTCCRWYETKGNAVIIFCIVWILNVFYTSAPFLRMDNNNKSNAFSLSSVMMSWLEDSAAAGPGIVGNYSSTNSSSSSSSNSSRDSSENNTTSHDKHDQQEVLTQNHNYNSPNYMRKRIQLFDTWFQGNETNKLLPNADENGTILDFAIVGFPKCGTTTVEANLGYLAPMPIEDICTPVHQTVWYAYKNWPTIYQTQGQGEEKLWRGTKCPAFIQGDWLISWSEHLPRTKLIVGVRHPVLWFQSFWNMQVANHLTKFAGDDPYKIMKPCPNANGRGCRNGCPSRQLLCMHRGRFHLALASLGKTALSQEERKWLAASDPDGGDHVPNHAIRNPIFVYEQTMLGEEYLWADMATYLGVDFLRHDKRVNSHGKNRALEIDFCNDTYDAFRAEMMPIAYEVASWLQMYLLPLARNDSRTDVVVANPDEFERLVEKYKEDPCGKLHRHTNGTFYKHHVL